MKSRNNIKLTNRKIIITAGGTLEPIDPVRYIANHSTGRMGIELAQVFKKYSRNVVLIYARISVPLPKDVRSIPVSTVSDLYKTVKQEMTDNSILIMSAAVSDFKPANIQPLKIKKKKEIKLKLVPTIDILKSLAKSKKRDNIFIGFALETNDLIQNALKKLNEKKLDLIVANVFNKKNNPFGQGNSKVYLMNKEEIKELPEINKTQIAKEIFKAVLKLETKN